MTNAMGFGPPNGVTIYFDFIAGKAWVRGAEGWVEQGTTPPPDPPPVDPPDPPPFDPPVVVGLKARLLADMTESHDGDLDGVPDDWDWAHQPKHGGGWNNPGPEYQAAVAWGQVYSSATPVQAVVEVGNMHLAVLSRNTNTWTVLQSTRPGGGAGIDGGYYRVNFANNESKPASITPAGTMIGTPDPEWNMHFYANSRASINNDDIAHVCVWYEARLASGSDSRARYLAGAGGDYWETLDAGTNTDIAIGKHRFLKVGTWTTLTAHTMSAHDLDTYLLPPVVLAGGGLVTPPPVVDPPTPVKWQLPTGRPVRVMAVGDSITVMQAEDPMGLATLAGQLPFPIELVGSQTTGTGLRHEGHGAWCADDTDGRCVHHNGYHAGGVLQSVAGWVTAANPDVVVLNVGQNDLYVRRPLGARQVAEAIGTIVDAVHLVNPNVMVCVTQFGFHNAETNIPLSHQITTRYRAGKNVRWYDAYRGFEDEDWAGANNIHPSPSGVVKMVAATAAALTVLASQT